jgi:hypothetical protein
VIVLVGVSVGAGVAVNGSDQLMDTEGDSVVAVVTFADPEPP